MASGMMPTQSLCTARSVIITSTVGATAQMYAALHRRFNEAIERRGGRGGPRG